MPIEDGDIIELLKGGPQSTEVLVERTPEDVEMTELQAHLSDMSLREVIEQDIDGAQLWHLRRDT